MSFFLTGRSLILKLILYLAEILRSSGDGHKPQRPPMIEIGEIGENVCCCQSRKLCRACKSSIYVPILDLVSGLSLLCCTTLTRNLCHGTRSCLPKIHVRRI